MIRPAIYKRSLIILAAVVLLCAAVVSTPAAEEAGFVGSEKCQLCHSKTYDEWKATPHGKLLTAQVSDTMKGCEACHGPGSLHVASTGKKKLTTAVAGSLRDFNAVCSSCHGASANNAAPKEWQKLDVS